MGLFNRSKVPSSLAVRLQGGDHTTGYGLEEQINDLNAELREARAQIAAKDAALTQIVNECSRFPIKDGLAFRAESIALNGLATPAGETA